MASTKGGVNPHIVFFTGIFRLFLSLKKDWLEKNFNKIFPPLSGGKMGGGSFIFFNLPFLVILADSFSNYKNNSSHIVFVSFIFVLINTGSAGN